MEFVTDVGGTSITGRPCHRLRVDACPIDAGPAHPDGRRGSCLSESRLPEQRPTSCLGCSQTEYRLVPEPTPRSRASRADLIDYNVVALVLTELAPRNRGPPPASSPTLDRPILTELAALPGVSWIGSLPQTLNDEASGIIGVTAANSGYDGTGQIIAITDTGIGDGTSTGAHRDIPSNCRHPRRPRFWLLDADGPRTSIQATAPTSRVRIWLWNGDGAEGLPDDSTALARSSPMATRASTSTSKTYLMTHSGTGPASIRPTSTASTSTARFRPIRRCGTTPTC